MSATMAPFGSLSVVPVDPGFRVHITPEEFYLVTDDDAIFDEASGTIYVTHQTLSKLKEFITSE